MSTSADHSRLVNEILVELGAMPGVIIGANPSGRARYANADGRCFFVPYGWPTSEGGPDILAVVAPLGRLVALEVKTGGAHATAAQRAVHVALRGVGVIVKVVRSVGDARAAIGEARNDISSDAY